jgi:hypothetical protein
MTRTTSDLTVALGVLGSGVFFGLLGSSFFSGVRRSRLLAVACIAAATGVAAIVYWAFLGYHAVAAASRIPM